MNQICKNLLSNRADFMLLVSFLIIVLLVYLFLYTYIKFSAHQSGISRRELLCRCCPHPASGIRLDISGSTANVSGIRPGHFLIRYGAPAFSFYRYWEVFPHKGQLAGLISDPSSYSAVSIFWPHSRWQDRAFFLRNCRLEIRFWPWSLSCTGG